MGHCRGDSPSGVDAHRPVPMPNVTSVISRAIRTRFDWHRIGIAIGVLIVLVTAVILFQLLRDIDADKVVAALRAKSLWDVLIARVFVAMRYTALTFYDFLALRPIGRDAAAFHISSLAGVFA